MGLPQEKKEYFFGCPYINYLNDLGSTLGSLTLGNDHRAPSRDYRVEGLGVQTAQRS